MSTKTNEGREIIVLYTSVDGGRKRRSFASLPGARRFAHQWVGEHPDLGSHYAVSDDGIGKVEVAGATLAKLFPPRTDDAATSSAEA